MWGVEGGRGGRGEGMGGEGKGREGKGREGKGREGKGREGKGREGKGREGKGRDGEERPCVLIFFQGPQPWRAGLLPRLAFRIPWLRKLCTFQFLELEKKLSKIFKISIFLNYLDQNFDFHL
jgi:hypothetical protein